MIEIAKDMLKRHEGYRVYVYADQLGIPTIGVGFNLKRADARARIEALGLNFDDVFSGKQPLNWKQIDRLLQDEVETCVSDLRDLIPGFDGFPEEARLVLVDLRYNLGPTRLRKFNVTLRAFREKKFKKAAKFLEGTLWARQVGQRAAEDVAMLRRLENGEHEA